MVQLLLRKRFLLRLYLYCMSSGERITLSELIDATNDVVRVLGTRKAPLSREQARKCQELLQRAVRDINSAMPYSNPTATRGVETIADTMADLLFRTSGNERNAFFTLDFAQFVSADIDTVLSRFPGDSSGDEVFQMAIFHLLELQSMRLRQLFANNKANSPTVVRPTMQMVAGAEHLVGHRELGDPKADYIARRLPPVVIQPALQIIDHNNQGNYSYPADVAYLLMRLHSLGSKAVSGCDEWPTELRGKTHETIVDVIRQYLEVITRAYFSEQPYLAQNNTRLHDMVSVTQIIRYFEKMVPEMIRKLSDGQSSGKETQSLIRALELTHEANQTLEAVLHQWSSVGQEEQYIKPLQRINQGLMNTVSPVLNPSP